jgi:hypothetical protein
LAEISTLLVVFAIFISIATVIAPESQRYMIFVVYLGIAIGWFYVTTRDAGRAKKQYKDFETRLMLLEDHRSNFGSLPHITLSKIVDPKFTTECLKRFLKENELSSTDSSSKEVRDMSGATSTERGRVIIESSILVITLLFVISQIGGYFKSALFVACLSGIAVLFVLSAILATAGMFPERVSRAERRDGFQALGVALFILGLLTLLALFVTMLLEFSGLLPF